MDFMQENEGQVLKGQTPEPAELEEKTGDAQEYLTVAAKEKDVRKTTCLLTVLFVIGLLCLAVMIKTSTPKVATAAVVSTEESQIEAAIAQLTGVKSGMFSRLDEIVSKFYQFSDVKQVKVDELQRNPFEYHTSCGAATVADIKQAGDMQLFSIMRSGKDNASRCCMINDKILYEGDSIGVFKVGQIGNDFVKLESIGSELVLRLSE